VQGRVFQGSIHLEQGQFATCDQLNPSAFSCRTQIGVAVAIVIGQAGMSHRLIVARDAVIPDPARPRTF